MPATKIVFMGSAEFGIPCLSMLSEENYSITGIVSTPPRPKGRGLRMVDSPVVDYAKKNNIAPVLTPHSLTDPSFLTALKSFGAELYIVVAFRLLPPEVFSIPPRGTLNVHASFLPKYRGPAPIQRVIEAGEKETGITIFRIDTGIDTGGVLLQQRVPILTRETAPHLHDRLGVEGARLLSQVLPLYLEGKLTAVQQDDSQASRAPKLKKEEARIDWGVSATVIDDRIRAFKPFPGTWTRVNGKRIGIERAEPMPYDSGRASGCVCGVAPEWFDVACNEGTLRIWEVKPEGKRSMAVHAFLCGTAIREGMRLG